MSTAIVQGPQPGAPAQEGPSATDVAAPKRALVITPRITVQETMTDNVAPGLGPRMSDWITELSPGVRVDWQGRRVKLNLDYALRELYYAKGSRGDRTLQSLNSFGTMELVENLFFVDFSGVIAQQSVSAFGVQSPGLYSVNANASETSNFRVSPFVKGRLGGYADYELRYSQSMMHSKSSIVSNTAIDEWRAQVGGDTAFAAVGWSADTSSQTYDFGQGRKSKSDRWRGMLSYRFDLQWKLSVSAGRESNDFSSLTRQSWGTHGAGVDWTPTERTLVSAFRESRFFGNGHTLTISHRMPLSAVKYVDSRDVAALPTQLTSVGMGNIYDLLFSQMSSAIPDPAERAAFVNDYLAVNNIPANSPVTSGFLSSRVSVLRNQQLSYLLRGARNSLSLALTRSQNDRLGLPLGSSEDFSLTSRIRQQGGSVTWSHQLTGLSTLNVTAARTQSLASGVNLDTTQKTLTASLATRLGAKTSAVVTMRRTVAERQTLPYTENAAVGALSFQF